MLIDELCSNVRLLERLTLFSGDATAAVAAPGSPEALFLQALEQLKSDDVSGALKSVKQLAADLHVSEDSQHLEPLRSLANIKSWKAGPEGQQRLKDFLIKALGLRFDEAQDGAPRERPHSAGAPPADGAAAAPRSLPSRLEATQYSAAAFQANLDSSGNKLQDAADLISCRDPSTLLQAIIDGSLGLKATVRLLQHGCIPPAALPAQVLVQVLAGWQAEWEGAMQQASNNWQNSPVLQWAAGHWDDMTAEQATAVRPVLPGPPYGSHPEVDRPYAVAQVRKALAGPADASAAGPAATGSSSGSVLLPWQCGAEAAAAAVRLQRVLVACDSLGPAAQWIRVLALYAQLQLQSQQQAAVDVPLLNEFLSLLCRCTWSHGGPFGVGQQQQQQQHPLHVSCSGCGARPIVGARFRSRGNYDINVCSRCLDTPGAANAAPYDEVTVNDSIYMLPEMDLPPVLHGMPGDRAALEQELQRLIEGVVLEAAARSDGTCLDAAGLQLPASSWSARVVAGAHLMSGKGDSEKWARQYEANKGSVSALRHATELCFAANSRTAYSLQDDVVLELFTKNIGTEGVLVKVYELNSRKLYTSTQAEADLNLELAGVAPTHTLTLHTLPDPLVRCRHRVPLGLSGVPGVWLVEVVAGSRRLRARVSKGGLRLWQRLSVAGQVLTIMDEECRPVTGVQVWCDGKQYTPQPSSAAASSGTEGGAGRPGNEVLLPFARAEGSTALVVAAQLPGAAGAAAGKECVVLQKDFRRLREQYSLAAQLFCHQEALLPGHTVPLVLMLSLQLHGTAAPLSLLGDLQLSVTAHTEQGAPVTQVIKDLSIDAHSRSALVSYTLPPNTTSLSASLSARILLALPGANGEPDYQDFDVQALLPGQTGLQPSVNIEAARHSSDIWDVYLTTDTTPRQQEDGPAASPSYMLQVLGRCGEPPSCPKTLLVWLDHTAFSPMQQLEFRVQTGPGGVVQLGPLQGIRQVKAQIEAGVDCVEGQAAAAAAAAPGEHAGPVRSWRIARPSWWVGGLQEQYVMSQGDPLEIPITPAASQPLQASLLQLVSPAVAGSSISGGDPAAAHKAAVAADISSTYLQVTAASSGLLGCGQLHKLSLRGLAAGLYRLVLPCVLLKPPRGGRQLGSGWDQGMQSRYMAVHIHVLPPAATDVTAAPDAAAGAPGAAAGAAEAAAVDPVHPAAQQWLYASPDSSSIAAVGPVLLQPSPPQQLHVASLTCSSASGLSLQVGGSSQLLQTAQVLLVFSRFLPDDSTPAAQLVPPQLPWGAPPTASGGFGFNPALQTQGSGWGFDSGHAEGLGYGAAPQGCGAPAGCSYSQDAQLDSAVAYVLQRRQWEAAGGGRRPGVLLDRPSLLVFPHSVRSAAAATSVLRGGDGGQLFEAGLMKKKMAGRHMAADCMHPHMAAAYGGGCPPPVACCAAPAGGINLARQVVQAETPVLSFLAHPAAVLTQLQLGPDGALHIGPAQLQQLLAEAAGGAAAQALPSAVGGNVLAALGCRVVYAAVYDIAAPGQFGVAWAPCLQQEGTATSASQQQQQHPAGSEERGSSMKEPCSCLPAAALKDMGLQRPVDPAVVSALSCDVVVLQPGDSMTLQNPEAAESGVYGSLQQLFQLLAGLMAAADSGGGFVPQQLRAGGGAAFSSDALQGLPSPCVPQGSKEPASAMLQHWEPLVLQWPLLGAAGRQDLVSKLASSELMLFLAVKDPAAYTELLLPLLRCKLPSELTCLEQILLLQAQHKQPPIPSVHTPQAAAAAAGGSSYQLQRQALLQHWYAPHRYKQVNQLERLLLAALEGQSALLQYSTDLMHQLQSPSEKRGMKRTWMSRERRAVFEYALLLAQSLEQQQQDTQGSGSDTDGDSDADSGGSEGGTDAAEGDEGSGSDSDFVKVEAPMAPCASGVMMMSAGAPAPMAMAPPPGGMELPPVPRRVMQREALLTGDMAARAQVAHEAADESNQVRVPKETKEWQETGWWRCEGPQPELIPAARFWAEFARHLATQTPGTPFVPSDPTDVAASSAAVITALAVTDLPWEGAPTTTTTTSSSGSATTLTTSSGSGSSRGRVRASAVGCVRSYQGVSPTITARAPCLLWVKMMKPLLGITSPGATAAVDTPRAAPTAGTAAGASAVPPTAVPASAVPAAAGASVASSVLVVDRLYDPRHASSSDPETGEEVLLALTPSPQQPLLAGQRYCRSVVVTSTVAAERELQLLVQLPQGAMALDGSAGTISRDVRLPPYTSLQLQQTFYFPQPGTFLQAPVSVVTVTGRPAWVPPAPPTPLYVVDASSLAGDGAQPAAQQADSSQVLDPAAQWRRVVKAADMDQLLSYLRTGDLTGVKLSDLSRFCRDPAFFSAAVSALNSRHLYDEAIWKYALLHHHPPALRQLLEASHLAQQLQRDHKVPMGRLLDSVFGGDSTTSTSSSSAPGTAGGVSEAAGEVLEPAGGVGVGEAGVEELCVDRVLKHLEFWPWVNPYCRPITHSGADANLPSVLRDNPAIAQQWKAFLLSLLMDCSSSSSGGGGSSGRLTVQQATTAAVFLLLQDRIDETEEVLTANGCWGQQAGGPAAAAAGGELASGPLSMQRDYLAAWLALARPLTVPGAAAAAGLGAGSGAGPAGGTQESVTADAIRVGTALLNKHRSCVAGAWVKRFKQLATLISQLEQQQTGHPQAASGRTAPEPASAQPLLSVVSLEGSSLKLHVAGLQQLCLSAYQIDTELLFSTQPFSSFSHSSGGLASSAPVHQARGSGSKADDGLGRVSFVQPTAQVLLQLQYSDAAAGLPGQAGSTAAAAHTAASASPADAMARTAVRGGPASAVTVRCTPVGGAGTSSGGSSSSSSGCGVFECVLEVDGLMPGLQQASVLLEVTGGGLSRSLPRFASSLVVHVLEPQGVLQVYCRGPAAGAASALTPAAAVYVKVYARREDGSEFFYKDGYTDLRGRFDYVTLTSTADMSSVVRYSLLVASRDKGAVMLQASPPPK